MNAYKIMSEGRVIDVNNVFLRWQRKHKMLTYCDPSDGEYIQSSDQEHVYSVPWLNSPQSDAPLYPSVDAVEINEEEFWSLKTQLDDGVEPEPGEDAEPEPDDEAPDDSEPVMSVAEMRRVITEQQSRIDMLEECLLEMSEAVYA